MLVLQVRNGVVAVVGSSSSSSGKLLHHHNGVWLRNKMASAPRPTTDF